MGPLNNSMRVRSISVASAWIAAGALSLLMSGCLSPCLFPGADCDPPPPVVTNGTDAIITIYSVGDAGEAFLAEVEPGHSHGVNLSPASECTGTLSIRAPDGTEIASRQGLCREEEWVVGQPEAS
jgi:hypothetical protein